jgi:hypothetical protein
LDLKRVSAPASQDRKHGTPDGHAEDDGNTNRLSSLDIKANQAKAEADRKADQEKWKPTRSGWRRV